ncbi:hypothetical protein CTM93_12415 [Photobacterium phosphoreum]|uniref:hypothetical protein n=1 Tax=Photobacterium phosphoreum TaxID=659 RepID=UPI000D181267|nr:hypothetical protein [Photobacterium phosphoreum]PSU82881.1 hypothetical protein CTM93_12415 [Photobacterium phosphoreum]
MSTGVVSFFKFTKLGFYRYREHDNCEPLEMREMLESLHEWFQDRISLEDTLLWDDETEGYSHRKKVYLKAIEHNPDTGDYILVLWRAIGQGNGVYGIRADSRLDDNRLYNADEAVEDNARVIWGEASYYWFCPRQNLFSSIRFHNSIADSAMVNTYFKDFIWFQSNVKQKVREVKEGAQGSYTLVTFKSDDDTNNDKLWFRCESKQYTKITTQADLGQIARDITHFVQRDVIAARTIQEQDWTRFFRSSPYVSGEVTKETRKIEINIEAKPTVEELRQVFERYNEEYSGVDEWRNLGFKKEGVGGICWLNKFVVKNTLVVSDLAEGGIDDTGHYTPRRLFAALELNRDSLLAPFALDEHEEDVVNG